MDSSDEPTGMPDDVTSALVDAVTVAGRAPSIHNTQPWHWRVRGPVADLWADTRRQLHVTDPDRRLLVLSCGAALHHAQVALAAAGVAFDLALMPSPNEPLHLARITHTGAGANAADATRLRNSIAARRTDRRALTDEPVPAAAFDAFRGVAERFDIGLEALNRHQVVELAGAVARAQRDELHAEAARRELDMLMGIDPTEPVGIPDANIPQRPTILTVPMRDFGHVGTLPIDDYHDYVATYAILHALDDNPVGWLHAGQALSAVWLDATEFNIAVLPLSLAVEQPVTRQMLDHMIGPDRHAQITLRLGISDGAQPTAPATPRLPPAVTVTVDP
jgi:hypothetical protein